MNTITNDRQAMLESAKVKAVELLQVLGYNGLAAEVKDGTQTVAKTFGWLRSIKAFEYMSVGRKGIINAAYQVATKEGI